jgi:ApbE superfamily uncharacterized protein (UPF0280 family)
MREQPVVQELTGGRLHLQDGPIDVVLKAWGAERAAAVAYGAAVARFRNILGELVEELSELRKPMDQGPVATGAVARRMATACQPFSGVFITPMAAVAGSVADELMATMRAAAPLTKAFVNDGGDIAIYLAPGETISIGVAADLSRDAVPALSGSVTIAAEDGIGGIATSGRYGRSFSLGIADSVTILARDAATADAAATLVGNAVNIEAPGVIRRPARDLDPDSDLGDLPVTVEVGPLTPTQISAALAAGRSRAEDYLGRGLIIAAALTLQSFTEIVGGERLLQFPPQRSR